jgi:hypothetical protein
MHERVVDLEAPAAAFGYKSPVSFERYPVAMRHRGTLAADWRAEVRWDLAAIDEAVKAEGAPSLLMPAEKK